MKNKKAAHPEALKRIGTKIIDDLFSDEISIFKPRFEVDYEAYLENNEVKKHIPDFLKLEGREEEVVTWRKENKARILQERKEEARLLPGLDRTDVPIYEYLEALAARGANIRDYRAIWSYS